MHADPARGVPDSTGTASLPRNCTAITALDGDGVGAASSAGGRNGVGPSPSDTATNRGQYVAGDHADFTFTNIHATADMKWLGLTFADADLEGDYQRFKVRDPSTRIGSGLTCLFYPAIIVPLLYQYDNTVRQQPLRWPLLIAACVLMCSLGLLLCGMRPSWHPRFIFSVSSLAVTFGSVTLSNFVTAVVGPGCTAGRMERLRAFGDESVFDACELHLNAGVTGSLAIMILVYRLPALYAIAVCTAIFCGATVAFFHATAVYMAAPSNAGVIVGGHALAAIFAVALVMGYERTVRFEFVRWLIRARTRETIVNHKRQMRRIATMVLPAHLTTLAEDTLHIADVRDRATMVSGRASVGVVGVVDFSRWTHGLLPQTVVSVLCGLVELLDRGTASRGVRRVAVYADLYVVEAGLAEPDPAHAGTVRKFLDWASQEGNIYGTGVTPALSVRTAAASGELCGSLVGVNTIRFVVFGQAMDNALAQLMCPDAVPARLHSSASSAATVADDFGTGFETSGVSPNDVHIDVAAADAAHVVAELDEHGGDVAAEHQLVASEQVLRTRIANTTRITNFFNDPAVAASFQRFAAEEERQFGRTGSRVLAALCIFLIAALVVERTAVPRHAFRPSRDVPAILLLLAAAAAVVSRLFYPQWRSSLLGLPVDTALVCAALLALAVALVLAQRFTPANDVESVWGVTTCAFLASTRRLHYLLKFAVCFLVITVPLSIAQWYAVEGLSTTAVLLRIIVFHVIIGLSVTLVHRAQRRRFALWLLEEHAITQANDNIAAQQELVQRVVPQQLVGATMSFLNSTAATGAFRMLFQHHNTIALEVVFRPKEGYRPSCAALAQRVARIRRNDEGETHRLSRSNLSDIGAEPGPSAASGRCGPTSLAEHGTLWDAVAVCVEAAESTSLQLVQAVGDTCLIAGPFAPVRESDLPEIAVRAVEVARSLARIAEQFTHHMLAACDVDWGFGALMGSQHRTYTILGPVTRTVRAIVNAAPRLPRSTALATAHFAAYCGPRYYEHTVDDAVYVDFDPPAAEFSEEMSWTVRDVGRLRVTAMSLEPTRDDS